MEKRLVKVIRSAAVTLTVVSQPVGARPLDPVRAPNPASKRQVKVFILAGQSNVEGQAVAELERQGVLGQKAIFFIMDNGRPFPRPPDTFDRETGVRLFANGKDQPREQDKAKGKKASK